MYDNLYHKQSLVTAATLAKSGPMSQALTISRSPLSIAFGGLIAMAVGIGVGRFVYTPILPPMLAGLGLSKTTAGLIASANFGGYLAGALLATRSAMPGSRRSWLLAALMASAASTAAMGLTESIGFFLALRFAGGVASALALILSSALVLDSLAVVRRPDLSAVHFAGVGAGIVLSAALVALMVGDGAGWASLWQASGAISLLGTVAVALLLPPETDTVIAHRSLKTSASHPGLRRMVLAYGLFGFGYVITATFLVAIVRATPDVRVLEPVIWIMVGLAAAPSVMIWTWLGRRIGIPLAFAVASLIEATGVLASVVSPNSIGICLAAVLVGGTFMGLTALGLMRGRELVQGDPRPVMAAMTCAFGVGQIVGPLLAGAASDALGGFAVPSVAAAGSLIVAAWLARR
jgi:predicted MFS family arabinose efflux permease